MLLTIYCITVPGVITDLTVADIGIQFIGISWNPPAVPNGFITSYEIAYGEYKNAGPHDNIINTTNTHYTIEGLLPNTSYDINVRAYTNIGAGEWTSTPILFTSKIRKLCYIPLIIISHLFLT